MVSFRRSSNRIEAIALDAPPIALRVIDEGRARAIVTKEMPDTESWAEGYPTDGDLEAAGMLIRALRAREDPGVFGIYEIVEHSSGLTVGGIGFHHPPRRDRSVEVGYGLVPSVWNKGYATIALSRMIELAFANGAERLVGRALPDNRASRRVMEKAGLSFLDIVEGYARYRIERAKRPLSLPETHSLEQ